MTVLASSRSHMAVTSASAAPAQPSPCSAFSTALPWTSSTPGFRNTWTMAFITPPPGGDGLGVRGSRKRPGGGESPPPGVLWTPPSPQGGGFGSMNAPLNHRRHLLHDAESAGDFGIALDHVAKVAAEPILVELLVRGGVPQAAAVRADLVGEDDAREIALPDPAELHLEVYERDAHGAEHAAQVIVDPERQGHDVVDLLGGSPIEGGDVLLGHHRVVKLVVLQIEFDDRAGQGLPLRQTEPLRERAGGDV